eukprot:GAHX01002440.1.p1 GENE.GAHX01002440.1~~GAHX01002440.1.p1  ORF type:complete len:437 (+),score=46.45 GAHX01002440.1:40-1350(+)
MDNQPQTNPTHDTRTLTSQYSTTESSETSVLTLIENGQCIDKTLHVVRLILSPYPSLYTRPSGFGKTTLIDTIETIAAGPEHKEKFKGTAIYENYLKNINGEYINNQCRPLVPDSNNNVSPVKYRWPRIPVFRISLKDVIVQNNPQATEKNILNRICQVASKYGLSEKLASELKSMDNIYTCMYNLFDLLYKLEGYIKGIIVMVDDYDACYHDYKIQEQTSENRDFCSIERFLGMLKELKESGYIRMILVTGTTNLALWKLVRFRVVWYHSYYQSNSAQLFGFTEENIRGFYSDDSFKELYANYNKCSVGDIKEDIAVVKDKVMVVLKQMYCGYKFTKENTHVLNSRSIIACFKNKQIKRYLGNETDKTVLSNELTTYMSIFNKLLDTTHELYLPLNPRYCMDFSKSPCYSTLALLFFIKAYLQKYTRTIQKEVFI